MSVEMKEAGKHRLTYRDYKGDYVKIYVSSVSKLPGPWIDVTKTMIPVTKSAFIKCPKCSADNWTEDSAHMNGYECASCGYEILAV